jgi:hypothetical protein
MPAVPFRPTVQVPNFVAGMMPIKDSTDEEIRPLYTAAREAGIDFCDHAALYGGEPHTCQRRLASALKLSPSHLPHRLRLGEQKLPRTRQSDSRNRPQDPHRRLPRPRSRRPLPRPRRGVLLPPRDRGHRTLPPPARQIARAPRPPRHPRTTPGGRLTQPPPSHALIRFRYFPSVGRAENRTQLAKVSRRSARTSGHGHSAGQPWPPGAPLSQAPRSATSTGAGHRPLLTPTNWRHHAALRSRTFISARDPASSIRPRTRWPGRECRHVQPLPRPPIHPQTERSPDSFRRWESHSLSESRVRAQSARERSR